MSSATYFSLIQRYLTRYGMTAYTALGNIGLLFNVAIFIRSARRRKPCSLYILAASLSSLIGLNISTIPVIYALDHPNPATTSLAFCQSQFYFRHSLNQMMRTFFIFACVDRYAISSNNARIRAFSQYRIALRITLCIPVIWFLLAIFPMTLRSLENGRCEGRSGSSFVILSVYIAVAVGIIPLLGMTIFGILMLKNLKNVRSRVQPAAASIPVIHRLYKRDRDLMRMLLIEIVCYLITTVPLVVNLLYQSATQAVMKNTEQQRVESFMAFITNSFLVYSQNGASFWIYVATSQSFRTELRILFCKFYTSFKTTPTERRT